MILWGSFTEMRKIMLLTASLCLAAGPLFAQESSRRASASKPTENQRPDAARTASVDQGVLFEPESVASQGSVTVGGSRIDYRAVAGTIVVHPRGWDDAAWRAHAKAGASGSEEKGALGEEDSNPQAESSMFYVAYFKKGVPSASRPIT